MNFTSRVAELGSNYSESSIFLYFDERYNQHLALNIT